MGTTPFGADYAEVYDALYADKDYAAECDLIERVMRREAVASVRSVLDLGCGTGRHAELLADRGYAVHGVDRSRHMVERARARAAERGEGNRPEYEVADLRTFRTDRRFDAVLMMFAVLGYQLEDADVLAALRTARMHLGERGLLLFDGWYGPAVLHQRPTDRLKTVESDGGSVRRKATSSLDVPRRRISIRFDVERTTAGKTVTSQETHVLRFYFDEDLKRFLASSGFSSVRIGAMPEFEADPDESTWNVLVVARAVELVEDRGALPAAS